MIQENQLIGNITTQELEGNLNTSFITIHDINTENGEITPQEDTQELTINFSNQHNDLPIYFILTDAEPETNPIPANSVPYWSYVSFTDTTGNIYPPSSGSSGYFTFYGVIAEMLRNRTNPTSYSPIQVYLNRGKTETTDLTKTCVMYYFGDNCIYPKVVNTSSSAPTQVFIANRKYKWYAIWKGNN